MIDSAEMGFEAGLVVAASSGQEAAVPALPWLLGGILLFIVLVGPVNMLVLRAVGRPEWSWVTIPVLSVLFLGGFWVVASPRSSTTPPTTPRWWSTTGGPGGRRHRPAGPGGLGRGTRPRSRRRLAGTAVRHGAAAMTEGVVDVDRGVRPRRPRTGLDPGPVGADRVELEPKSPPARKGSPSPSPTTRPGPRVVGCRGRRSRLRLPEPLAAGDTGTGRGGRGRAGHARACGGVPGCRSGRSTTRWSGCSEGTSRQRGRH